MDTSLLSLTGFAIAASITPGPNNVMIAASAAHHGVRATVPHMLGVVVGFAAMMAIVGLGFAGVLTALPAAFDLLRWVALGWMAVLAWKIATAAAPGEGRRLPPLGFLGGVLFQWVNPKGWLVALSVPAAFVSADHPLLPQVAVIAATWLVVALPCIWPWAVLGSAAGRLLRSPARLRAFNVGMAVLLVASMLPVAFPG